MNEETRQKLLTLNQNFYQTVATEFDASRQGFWEGWGRVKKEIAGEIEKSLDDEITGEIEQLLDNEITGEIEQSLDEGGKKIIMIDLGCGNGRWADFFESEILEKREKKIEAQSKSGIFYYGFDQDKSLLKSAKDKMKTGKMTCEFQTLDLSDLKKVAQEIEKIVGQNQKSLVIVTLMAVLHHLPGGNFRREFLESVIDALPSQSLLIMSLWQFYNSKRFQKKVLEAGEVWKNLDLSQLEPGDYFLPWADLGSAVVRYCHHFSESEIDAEIIPFLELSGKIRARLTADPDSQTQIPLNTYLIWQKNMLK